MKTTKTILTLVIGIAIGAMANHFFSQHRSAAVTPTGGLKILHSVSHPERTAMEADFANQYANFHRARDLEGLMAMMKLEGVGENGVSSLKEWKERSFAQQIVGVSFRELNDWEIRKRTDFSLEPLLECKISYRQTSPDDVMVSTTYTLGVEAGHLYVAERACKE